MLSFPHPMHFAMTTTWYDYLPEALKLITLSLLHEVFCSVWSNKNISNLFHSEQWHLDWMKKNFESKNNHRCQDWKKQMQIIKCCHISLF